jgi:hypothetical protein
MVKGGQRHVLATLSQGKSLGTYTRRGYIGWQAGVELREGKIFSYSHLGFNP